MRRRPCRQPVVTTASAHYPDNLRCVIPDPIPATDFVPISGSRQAQFAVLGEALNANPAMTVALEGTHWQLLADGAVDQIGQAGLLTEFLRGAPETDREQIEIALNAIREAQQQLMRALHPHYNRHAVRARNLAAQEPS
jgi:hypothetical protein